MGASLNENKCISQTNIKVIGVEVLCPKNKVGGYKP